MCFVAGEMLDWEAPTGGYLLTASMASGVAAARGVLGAAGPCRETQAVIDGTRSGLARLLL